MNAVEGLILFFSIVAAVCSFLVFYKLFFLEGKFSLSRSEESKSKEVRKKKEVFIIPALRQISRLIENEVSVIKSNKGDATIIQFWNQVYLNLAKRISSEEEESALSKVISSNKKEKLIKGGEFLGSTIYSKIIKPLTLPSFMRRYTKLAQMTKTQQVEDEIFDIINSISIEAFLYQIKKPKESLQKDYTKEQMDEFSWSNHNLDAHTLGIIKNACQKAYQENLENLKSNESDNIKLASISFILEITTIMEKSKILIKRLELLNKFPPT